MSDQKVVKNTPLAYASQDKFFLDAYVDESYNYSLKKCLMVQLCSQEKKLFLYYDFTGVMDNYKGDKKLKKVIGERYREYYR